MEQETATLVLNTFDISSSFDVDAYYNTTIDNQYGTISNNRCNLTWKNINLRNLLGTIYDKYETFKYIYIKYPSPRHLAQYHQQLPFYLLILN